MTKKKDDAADNAPEPERGATNVGVPAFVFVGDPSCGGHGPDEIEVRGYTFRKNGEPTAVNDPKAAAMFANHTHFKAA